MTPGAMDPQHAPAAHAMVRSLGIIDPRIASVMRSVPRHRFVPPESEARAYEDEPLGLGLFTSTISAPHMVVLQLAALDLRHEQSVLEIGSGSGYLAALIAELVGPVGHVLAVERVSTLAERSRRLLSELGYGTRVDVVCADGRLGWPARAPYDRIAVSAATPRLEPQWRAQLREGGRLVLPLGPSDHQRLLTVRAGPDGDRYESGPECRFVPLAGPGSPHI